MCQPKKQSHPPTYCIAPAKKDQLSAHLAVHVSRNGSWIRRVVMEYIHHQVSLSSAGPIRSRSNAARAASSKQSNLAACKANATTGKPG